jgi:hypothetical protein
VKKRPRPTFECPNCGERVRRGALACPECGADAETGWAEEAGKWAGDIPTGYAEDEDFDYDDFLAREGLDGAGPLAPHRLRRLAWRAAVVLVVLALIYWTILR